MVFKKTKESMHIFWTIGNNGQEYSEGILMLACWYNYVPRQFNILPDELKDMFEVRVIYPSPEEEDFDYEGKGEWIQVGFDLLIKKWPESKSWKETIYELHKNVFKYKPVTVYCVIDQQYNDPPEIFSSDYIKYIWAAMTDNGKFYFHSELMEEYSPLTEEELKELDIYVKKRMKEIEGKEQKEQKDTNDN